MGEPLIISELIKKLEAIKEKRGDIKVGTWNDGIIKFIRSIRVLEATDANGDVVDTSVELQWWDEEESE